MKRPLYLKILPYALIIIAVLSIQRYSTIKLGNTTVFWAVQTLLLFSFWMTRKFFYDYSQDKSMIFIYIYLSYNILSFIYGLFMAEIYWDVKALINNMMALLAPLVLFISTNPSVNQKLLSKYLFIGLPLFFPLMPTLLPDTYGEFLVPISFLLMFIFVLNIKYKGLLIFFVLIIFLSSLASRSNVIKYAVPLILSFLYLFRNFNINGSLKLLRFLFLAAPLLLLLLTVNGVFNPFDMDSYIEGEYTERKETIEGELREENLKADTRTPIYIEVILSAKKHNYWIFGRSPARGNDTEIFGDEMEQITGRRERYGNEASILNIFTWTGIVGVFLYFLVFMRASYLGIYHSNNIFSKMIGLFIAFRWAYAWVEDFTTFNLHFIILWMMIGMCMSVTFRNMNDTEMIIWVRGIFDKRYRNLNIS